MSVLDHILTFIAEHAGWVFAFIILLVVVVGLVAWFASRVWHQVKDVPAVVQKFEEQRDTAARHDERLNLLPCREHEARLHRQNDDYTELKSVMGNIAGKLDILIAGLGISSLDLSAGLFSEKHSPRRLNGQGQQLFDDVGGTRFLDENQDFLFSKLAEKQPKTALDVENMALMVLNLNAENDIFNVLKNWVYNAPSREVTNIEGATVMYDVTLKDVFFVLSLDLRDRYLRAHPEISPDTLD